MIKGIRYEKVAKKGYALQCFDREEITIYRDKDTFKVKKASKTIYENYVPIDSKNEKVFASDCESSEQVTFYLKLPPWFTIPTPIGTYNPDWAIIFKDANKIYFIVETKDTGDKQVATHKLRPLEKQKLSVQRPITASLTE